MVVLVIGKMVFKDVWVAVTHSIVLLLVPINKDYYLDKYSGKIFGNTFYQLELGSVVVFHDVFWTDTLTVTLLLWQALTLYKPSIATNS